MIHYDVQRILGQIPEGNGKDYQLKVSLIAAIGVLAGEISRFNDDSSYSLRMAITEGFTMVAAGCLELAKATLEAAQK